LRPITYYFFEFIYISVIVSIYTIKEYAINIDNILVKINKIYIKNIHA